MPVCIRCHSDVGFLGRINFNNQTRRCGKCEREVTLWLTRFRTDFINMCNSGTVTTEGWDHLTSQFLPSQISLSEALVFIRGDAMHFLERALAFAYSDGIIEKEEEQGVHELINLWEIPANLAQPILARLEYLKRLSSIHKGILPIVRASIHLEVDEFCHMEMDAKYHKVNARFISYVPGRLVATNKKLHFLSASGGSEIPWKRIMRVSREGQGIYLELSTKKGNGHYDVADPTMAEAIIETVVKMSKRQLIAPQADHDTRRIPQHIKNAVWQRDQGKCVQCGAGEYLEFDHIIPFGKGGATSDKNLQLLCRKCNLTKGGRL